MAIILHIHMADGWALTADRYQWILRRKHGSKGRPVPFERSNKLVLMRILREHGLTLIEDVIAFLIASQVDFLTDRQLP